MAGGVNMNKEKMVDMEAPIDAKALLNNRYILVQKGKKNYFLIVAK